LILEGSAPFEVCRRWASTKEVVWYYCKSKLYVDEKDSEGEDRECEESGEACEEGDGEGEEEEKGED
jgi:hypothetical protein